MIKKIFLSIVAPENKKIFLHTKTNILPSFQYHQYTIWYLYRPVPRLFWRGGANLVWRGVWWPPRPPIGSRAKPPESRREI